MEKYHTTMSDLFEQLGLASSDEGIVNFISQHKGLRQGVHIEEADFWTRQQADFIKTALLEDAEWTELIDQLNTRVR
ncbi:MAG: hypothetical protein ACI9C4_001399 [Paraglaciecola sp.]|jgi:hypothetical protein